MKTELTPVVGNWFQTLEGPQFEVVEINNDEGIIEIQYFDGQIDELSFEEWSTEGIIASAEPDEWTGAYEDMELEEFGFTDTSIPTYGQSFSLEDFDRSD